jgi:hypothetical protein
LGAYDPSLLLDLTNGNNTLSPAITFTRTTNATVTGSNGLIQNAPMNLLTFSEQFDNAAWTKNNITIAANSAVSPNGQTTADTAVESLDVAATNHQISLAASFSFTSGVVYTHSIFAKPASGIRSLRLSFPSAVFTGGPIAYFDLQNGTVLSGTDASITSVGDGWYRCSHTKTATTTASSNSLIIGMSQGTTRDYVGNGTSGIYLWGAQLESNATATTYNPTTVKNLLGFTENFDNAAWTKSNAFVQTNLVLQSQSFDNATWTKSRITITANAGVAPDGTTTASSAIPTADSGSHNILQNINATAINTGSWYVKPTGTYTKVAWFEGANTGNYVAFDLSGDGSVLTTSGATGTVSQAGNGWYRITFYWTNNPGTLHLSLYALSPSYTSGNPAVGWIPNGTDGFLIWGAQLVQGATLGDYKATYAAAAAVGYTDIYGQPFAQKLVENTANSTHTTFIASISKPAAATPYTFSIYLQAAERSTAQLRIADGSASANRVLCDVNLTAQTAVASSAGTFTSPSATITPVGSGWFRVSLTGTTFTETTLSCLVFLTNPAGTTSYTGDGTSGIYIFGAQLSDSASVDPYVYQPVAAPTSTAYFGPRFDYDPVTLQPKGLLIEEQRTNLVTYSEQFDNAAWSKVNSTITANSTTAPDGSATADTFIPTVTAGTVTQTGIVKTAASITYTFSFYAKAAGFTSLRAFVFGSSNANRGDATFDLSNETVSSVASVGGFTNTSATITNANNGWYRCTITTTSDTTTALAATFRFDGTVNGTSGFFLWGAQLEAGAFATSYIPTVASQVTRAADNASMIGNNFARWYNQTEGTVFVQANAAALVASSGNPGTFVGISDGTVSNRLRLKSENGTAWEGAVAGTSQFAIGAYGSAGVSYKLAGAYKVNDFAYSFSGTTAATDTSGTVPFVSQMQIGNLLTAREFNGTISRIAYYNRRLSNTELQGITS